MHPARLPFVSLLSLALLGAAAAGARAQREASPIPDFTFIHTSDIHVPPGVTRLTGPAGNQFGSTEVVAQIKTLTAPIELKPYNVTVPAPSFAIATGDLTEFGSSARDGWWDTYLGLWKGAPFPVWHVSGNHDSTWASQRYQIRKLHGGAFYSFDFPPTRREQGLPAVTAFGGAPSEATCHFIGWDSASVQDPRPSFGEEELNWLREDLKKVKKETPVFLFCHHPIDGNEFASIYERDRLLDILRPYNLVLLLVGHGHSAVYKNVAGVDQVMGGSAFGAAPGYSVVSVKDGVLRVAYRTAYEPTPNKPLLERPLTRRSEYPSISFSAPVDSPTVLAGPTPLRVSINRKDVTEVKWEADDEKGRSGTLTAGGSSWQTSLDTAGWEQGAHYIRVTFTAGGKQYQKTTRLYTRTPERRAVWRSFMRGSGKGTPTVDGGLVIAGDQDGYVNAFDRDSGKRLWRFKTGGEILASPLVYGDRVYFGSGDGLFYALDRQGNWQWSFKIEYPSYSSPMAADGKILLAANNGRIYALTPDEGKLVWECSAPDYSIESRPVVANGLIYYGSWDGYTYALDLKTGAVRWRTQGVGSKAALPGVMRYYAPADAGPVVAGGKVWVADRAFRLTVMDALTGAVVSDDKAVSSVAVSEDGQSVYLRGTDGNLRKVAAADARPLWTAPAGTNVVPSAPAEKGGVVYSVTATGRLVAFAAADGKRLWEYQVTPRLYVFSDPVPHEDRIYVTGMDGSLTALRKEAALK